MARRTIVETSPNTDARITIPERIRTPLAPPPTTKKHGDYDDHHEHHDDEHHDDRKDEYSLHKEWQSFIHLHNISPSNITIEAS
jgi:hypothetical protein